jgi:hypothetical protein
VDKAWRAWSMMSATDWKHLPEGGGLLDQSEALMNDVLSIEFMHRRLRAQAEG